MKQITTMGLDLAKQIFQIHGADAEGNVIINRKLRRAEVLRFFEKTPPCLVGIEACGSAQTTGRARLLAGARRAHDAASLRQAVREAG